jgi:hypothetical protein
LLFYNFFPLPSNYCASSLKFSLLWKMMSVDFWPQSQHHYIYIFISHTPTWYRDTKYTIYNIYIIYVQFGSLWVQLTGRAHTFNWVKGRNCKIAIINFYFVQYLQFYFKYLYHIKIIFQIYTHKSFNFKWLKLKY